MYHILPYLLKRKRQTLIKLLYLNVYSQRNLKEAFEISKGSCPVKRESVEN